MLEARRRAGFVLDALQLARVHSRGKGQHFERDAPAKGDSFRFEDDAHAAACCGQ
jgi:hypothetical protein